MIKLYYHLDKMEEKKVTGMTGKREVLIKCKTRVQKHGEVFTPKWMVEKMLDIPEIKEACEKIEPTFLEPSAGEGAFLIVLLSRKLEMVSRKYNENMKQYENYSLFALTTLYGIELLEDNTKKCVLNLYQVYLEYYDQARQYHGEIKRNHEVLNSAKTIITLNIRQGDFLTRMTANGDPIIFNEWKPISNIGKNKVIKVIRTEYTLDEIQNQVKKDFGETVREKWISTPLQLNLFIGNPNEEFRARPLRYVPCSMQDISKELMEY